MLGLRFRRPAYAGDAGRRYGKSRDAGVLQGETLWASKAGATNWSCADCHGDPRTSMKGVAACYPTFEPELAQPLDLEGRINRCRVEHQGAAPFAWESEDLLALTAFVAYQSRGPPITVPSNAALWPFFDFGRRAVSSPPGSAKPVLQPVSRRQLRKASRRCRHPAGPPDGLPGLSPRMAEFGYAATAAAQLHGRRARRALRVQRAGSRGARALPDGARPRHADRNTGGAPLTKFRCRLGKNRIGPRLYFEIYQRSDT